MLLDRYPTLFLVEFRTGFSAPKLYVEVSYPFIKDAAAKRWFDLSVPHCLWVKMEVFTKTARDHYPTG
jgi:hypothetical protein